MKMRRWMWRTLQTSTVVTAIANGTVLFQHPFAERYVTLVKAEAELALDRAIRTKMTPSWVATQLDRAVENEDLDRTELLLELVEHHRIPVAEYHTTRAGEFVDRETGIVARAQQCSACLADTAECRTPTVFMVCNIPIEMTFVGDIRTLVEAGSNIVTGEEVNRIDVTLAAVGLGAAALTPATGGSSYTIKVGATVLKVARKMGRLSGGLGRILGRAAAIPIRWNKMDEFMHTRKLSAITDVRHLEVIGDIAKNLGTVSKHANTSDVIFLLKHVDSGKDAAELARVSKVAGKRTRGTIEVLGLKKAGIAIKRLSNLFMLAVGLIVAMAGQLAALTTPICLRLLRRIVDPGRKDAENSGRDEEDPKVGL